MYVTWDACEYGAPAINPKRPYGNSFVESDIAEILGWDLPNEDDDDFDQDAYEDACEKLEKIHKETEIALQIILVTQSFVEGTYVKHNPYDDRDWKLVS
jgi:hypothetical protein